MADMVVERERSSSAGPIVAIIALLVLGFLVYLLWAYFGTGNDDTTDVEVNNPVPSVNVEPPAQNTAPAEDTETTPTPAPTPDNETTQ